MKQKTLQLLLLILILLCACAEKHTTSNLRKHPEFKDAYIDLLFLQESLDSSLPAYEDSAIHILEKHHITQEEYTQTMNALNNKPERWEAFLQEVLDQLNSIDSTRIRVSPEPVKSFDSHVVE